MEERNYCLYYHKSPSGKIYVGITSNIKRRWSGKGIHYKPCKCFYNAIKCYGWDNIEHHVLHESLTLEEASSLEKLYIRLWGTLSPNGYNLADGGGNGNAFAGKTEEEMKEIGKKIRESVTGDKNPMYGKTRDKSPYARKVKVYDKKGNFINEYPVTSIACEELGLDYKKCCQSISKCALGKTKSAYGYIWEYTDYTEEEKQIREHNIRSREPKKVRLFDKDGNFINEFKSTHIACEELGLDYKKCKQNISKCALGKTKNAYGYIWEY